MRKRHVLELHPVRKDGAEAQFFGRLDQKLFVADERDGLLDRSCKDCFDADFLTDARRLSGSDCNAGGHSQTEDQKQTPVAFCWLVCQPEVRRRFGCQALESAGKLVIVGADFDVGAVA